jgi:hypothetical protein
MLSRRQSEDMRPKRSIYNGSTQSTSLFLSLSIELKRANKQDIFQFFVAQLTINLKPPPQNARLPPIALNKSITDSQFQSQSQSQTQASQRVTEVPYYNEYCYLLESLATIKSASLACDVPDSEEILTGFFDGFTEVVRQAASFTEFWASS